jgi:hypothetical protein
MCIYRSYSQETIGFPHRHVSLPQGIGSPEGYVMPSWLEQKDATALKRLAKGDEGVAMICNTMVRIWNNDNNNYHHHHHHHNHHHHITITIIIITITRKSARTHVR